MQFSAFAREDIPALLDEVDQLTAELAACRQELEKYRVAEEDGRLIELPCRVGDTVYVVEEHTVEADEIIQCKIHDFRIDARGISTVCIHSTDGKGAFFGHDYFNETAFLTREEAEAVLMERSANK